MSEKKTLKVLETQIVELKRQIAVLKLESSFQKKEGQKTELFDEKESWKDINAIMNSMGDPVFVKDDKSRLLLVNDAFCEIFGLSRAEILGKTLAEDVPPDERESFLKIDMQVLSDGKENVNEESLTVRGREAIFISTRKSRFIDSNGEKFLVGVIRDITDRKKTEQALIESEAQFRELNATKDILFSIIGHDLRGPFGNILVLSQLLIEAEKEVNLAELEQYLGMINSTAKNTLVLLDNLLNWAKSQTGQFDSKSEKINISASIQEVLELSDANAKTKNISLNLIKSDEIEVNSDKEIFKTILRNLISNAIKFTEPGGNVGISVNLKENQAEITISDDGIGINEETCKKLFSVSSNISSLGTANEVGSGFGLFLCKEFVQKLGGRIWVESKEGKGSDFKFTLPLNRF